MFRRTARWCVRLCVKHEIHPDAVSYASLVASAFAGLCFLFAGRYHRLLLIGPLLCYLRLWCNMLDGMVAVASGKASRRGEILNDLPDRFSDVIVFAAVAESGLCHPTLGYWTAIAAVLTAYVGILSQAVGAPRQFSGWMSKPWRMVALGVGSWATFVVLHDRSPATRPFGLSPLDVSLLVIVSGCVQTIVIRLRQTLGDLSNANNDPTHARNLP